MYRFALHSTRVLTPQGLQEATIVVNGKKIESLKVGRQKSEVVTVEDLGNNVIMPGLIDSHVHINEPGRTDWEGFNTATRAAAAGGITTLVDMPLNSSPVTTDVMSLQLKVDAAKKSLHVNCGFYGGVIPTNLSDLPGLLEAGVMGIKAFLTHSGIDDFPNVTEEHLRKALPLLKKFGVTLLVHAELDEPHPDQKFIEENPTSYSAYLRSRPKSWEDKAINMLIRLCEEYQTRIHIVHLSSANSIAPIKAAIKKGLPISVETCPHYLVFHAEEIKDKQTQFKCAPPIREKQNNEQLWKAVRDKVISFIVTDHSPSLPEMKELKSGSFKKAWGGIAGLQFSLPAFWTHARQHGFTIEGVAMLMSSNVAKFLDLEKTKGKLGAGYDADLVVWNPEKEFVVTRDIIQHKHKLTPYEGLKLSGVVERTYVNGSLIFENGDFHALHKGVVIRRKNWKNGISNP